MSFGVGNPIKKYLWGDMEWDRQTAMQYEGPEAARDEYMSGDNQLRRFVRMALAAYGLGSGVAGMQGAMGAGGAGGAPVSGETMGAASGGFESGGLAGGQWSGAVSGGQGVNLMSTGTGAGQSAPALSSNLDTANSYMSLANQAKSLTESNGSQGQVGQPYTTGYDLNRDERERQRVSQIFGSEALYGRGGGMYG